MAPDGSIVTLSSVPGPEASGMVGFDPDWIGLLKGVPRGFLKGIYKGFRV